MSARAIAWLFCAVGCLASCASTGEQVAPRAESPGTVSARQAVDSGACQEGTHEPFPEFGAAPRTDRPATPLVRVAPEDPDIPGSRIGGAVVVAALVCEHGRVVQTRIVRSLPLYNEAAEKALKAWEFDPARLGSRTVASWYETTVTFTYHNAPTESSTGRDVRP